MRPRSQWEGKPTSVRCRTVSQPPSRTYLLPKILSSITTDKSRLSAQFFWGNFCFDVYVVPDHSLASHSAHWPTVWCLYLDARTGRTYQKPEEKAKSWWTELTSLSLRYIDFYLFPLFSFFFSFHIFIWKKKKRSKKNKMGDEVSAKMKSECRQTVWAEEAHIWTHKQTFVGQTLRVNNLHTHPSFPPTSPPTHKVMECF